MALPVTDDFAGTGALADPPWTTQQGTPVRVAGVLGTATEGYAFRNDETFPNSQYSQAKVTGFNNSTDYAAVSCRCSGTGGSRNAYYVYTDGVSGAGHSELAKVVAGTDTILRNFATTFAANDVLRIEARGTTLEVYKNGGSLGTQTDASLASGAAGVAVFGAGGTVDDFEGGLVDFEEIAYKSQGAGASTETSGAALSPACPATVDAGDVLIGFVFWEGTTTAPSTPSGWTLLDGPRVVESTIARMWVFGKIADGSEDGAAVAFGSPSVTTQRGARIHSFTGRVGGTITELVGGFGFNSHATDPQMVAVTTPIAGALAVSFVAQNDNNALAAATGETGGDWVEAVAEYVAALTPGLVLQCQIALPTANPGTITGGAVAATNDPSGVIGFYIRPSAHQTVAAGVGAATFAGFAATVSVGSSGTNVAAGTGAAVFTGFEPTVTVSDHKNVAAGTGQVTATGFEPTVFASNHQNVAAGVAAVDAIGFAPTVVASDHRNVLADVGAATFNGFAATVLVAVAVFAGTGQVVAHGFAPTVSVTAHQDVLAGVGQVAVTGFAPTVVASDHQNVAAGVGAATFDGFAPVVFASDHQVVAAGFGAAVFNGFAPTVQAGTSALAGTGAATFAGFAPTITLSDNKDVDAGTAAVAVNGFAPTISLSAHQNVLAQTGQVLLNGFAPAVTASQHQQVLAGTASVIFTGFAPLAFAGVNAVPGPLPFGLQFADEVGGLGFADEPGRIEFTDDTHGGLSFTDE